MPFSTRFFVGMLSIVGVVVMVPILCILLVPAYLLLRAIF